MLDELMRSLEQDHQEWQRNKALKRDDFLYVNWLRTFAAGHQLYMGLDDESKPSPAAKPVEAPRGCKPQVPRREDDREDAAKNNGRVGGKAESIVPKTAEPPVKKGCVKCGNMGHRVAWCPKTASGETETLLAAQVKRWKDGIKLLVNQPQRHRQSAACCWILSSAWTMCSWALVRT
ncbi:hypothetical protein DYB28_000765 [Aphanomyces astaci]|uniref:CCHC-type domain-containing protein n=1 Tax=Aphanomyces astaci TaxID=112090 RepID=A0A9X8H4J6_APHAT|nr:hypothetical protein DYB28_000765 [Aphanomyces astaci]